jgi:hydrogenase-4 component H
VWITSKLRQLVLVSKPGVVTLRYPLEPAPAPTHLRGAPVWDHHKCLGCGGCSDHCVSRCILVADPCQELRVMFYDGSRCTYCGRCADVCPEKAITMSPTFELATDDREDITTRIELFMLTCQRCGRCYELETSNVIDRLAVKGFRHDNLETRAMVKNSSPQWTAALKDAADRHARPTSLRPAPKGGHACPAAAGKPGAEGDR